MEIKIRKSDYNDSIYGSQKKVVMVEFPNCKSSVTGKRFRWMPTYRQLEDIKEALDNIEEISWGE